MHMFWCPSNSLDLNKTLEFIEFFKWLADKHKTPLEELQFFTLFSENIVHQYYSYYSLGYFVFSLNRNLKKMKSKVPER